LVDQVTHANAEIQALNKRLESENLRMEAELDVAQQLQQMLLPTPAEIEQIEGLDIAGFMQPAAEVGGDYYDVLEHNGRIKIGIGDVTGHGLESGIIALMLQTAICTLVTSDITDRAKFIDILNRTIRKNIRRMNTDKSLSLALFDYVTAPSGQAGKITVSGQHEQVIVVRKGGQVELKDTFDLGFPVGLIADIGEHVNELSINLQPGDGIVLYSDGITEAENEAKEFYGLERLCQVISKQWLQSSDTIKQAVVDDVQAYIGEQIVYDDITLLVVKQR
jgi:serine phosphatase RsbU (regulator of sigma subunit)